MGAREHRQTVAKTRQAVFEYADRASGQRVLRILKDAAKDLEKRIDAGEFEGDYTAVKKKLLLKQIRQSTIQLAKDLKDHVVAESVDAATDSGKQLVNQIGAAEKRFKGIAAPLPIDEVAVMDAAAEGAESSVLSRLVGEGHAAAPGILGRYGAKVIGHFENRIQRGMLAGESMDEIADGLKEHSPFLQGQPRFWAERIARTEVHGAYARAAHKGMVKAHEELGDVCRIAVTTFDSRTAPDSFNMHGQIRRVNEPFEHIGNDGESEQFLTPPDRPNDRGIVVVHRTSWGPPPAEWKPLPVAKVVKAYVSKGMKFPGRPKMTTIPMSKFTRESPSQPDEDQEDSEPEEG